VVSVRPKRKRKRKEEEEEEENIIKELKEIKKI